LPTSSPDLWLPQHALPLPAQLREHNDVGDRGHHVHEGQRPRRRSRGARQGYRGERKEQTNSRGAPEDAHRVPREAVDDGEYDSRAKRAGHTGDYDLTERYRLVGRDDHGPKKDDAIASTIALALADKRAVSAPTRKSRLTRIRSNLKVLGAVRSITYLLKGRCRCLPCSLHAYFTICQV
jgi:hypothetical protein